MSQLLIRVPASQGMPARWHVVSTNGNGPGSSDPGLLHMMHGDGTWHRHVRPSIPSARPLYVRDKTEMRYALHLAASGDIIVNLSEEFPLDILGTPAWEIDDERNYDMSVNLDSAQFETAVPEISAFPTQSELNQSGSYGAFFAFVRGTGAAHVYHTGHDRDHAFYQYKETHLTVDIRFLRELVARVAPGALPKVYGVMVRFRGKWQCELATHNGPPREAESQNIHIYDSSDRVTVVASTPPGASDSFQITGARYLYTGDMYWIDPADGQKKLHKVRGDKFPHARRGEPLHTVNCYRDATYFQPTEPTSVTSGSLYYEHLITREEFDTRQHKEFSIYVDELPTGWVPRWPAGDFGYFSMWRVRTWFPPPDGITLQLLMNNT